MRVVLDASVAIAAMRPSEPAYAAARACVERALQGLDVIVEPSFFVVEVAGALTRLGYEPAAIDAFLRPLMSPPHEIVTVGAKRAQAAARVAITTKLRGPDALYVWLAAREQLSLLTLDREILARGTAACRVSTP